MDSPRVVTAPHPPICPFCFQMDAAVAEIAASSADVAHPLAVCFPDKYPSAPGHLLVVPGRHVARLADLSPEELAALWSLAMAELAVLQSSCDSVNVGINDGPEAGQTVPHVHFHLIPRNRGDVADARGGVRYVLPATAAYWDDPT